MEDFPDDTPIDLPDLPSIDVDLDFDLGDFDLIDDAEDPSAQNHGANPQRHRAERETGEARCTDRTHPRAVTSPLERGTGSGKAGRADLQRMALPFCE